MKHSPLVISVLFGAIVCLATAFDTSSEVSLVSRFQDYLFMPGMFIASLVWPEGIHSGDGFAYWGFIAYAINFLVYSSLFFLVLWLLAKIRR